MARLFWLSNEAWAVIEPHLPRGQPGKPRVDDRRVISGILHVLKVGCRWRDVPAELTIDSTHVKAHRSASGGKGGSGNKRSGARGVGARARSIAWPILAADRLRSR